MAQLIINTGSQANDATGDLLRDAFTKTNTNFTTLFSGTLPGSFGLNGVTPPAQTTGWGTPVGAAVVNNYNISDAGGANSNTNKAVAEILVILKAYGMIGN
jgi:hypothetical protein